MDEALRNAYQRELSAVRAAVAAGETDVAFHHLERAHILSQRDTIEHVRVHGLMLRLGYSTRSGREVIGQAVRIVAAALFSRIWVPLGNTGRANVSALRPMPVPEDLRAVLAPGRPGSAPWR
jgi:hypothetical protein